jgi:hypothetical protein
MKRSDAVRILLVCLTVFVLAGRDSDVTRASATSASVGPVSHLNQNINILAPDVVFLEPTDSTITEKPVVAVRVLVRSRIPLINIILDVNGEAQKFKPDPASTGDRYIFEREIKLSTGRNRIEVTAFNEKAFSIPAALTVFFEPNQQAKPSLYVLAIGVSKIDHSGMTGKTAALDTEAFSKLMNSQKREDGLFGNVEVTTLIDEKATREAILVALDQLRERKKSDNDVTILFLTGNLAIDYFDNSIYFLTANYKPKVNLVVDNIRYSLFWEYLSSTRGRTVIFANTGWGNDGGKYPFERFADAYEKGEVNSFFASRDGVSSQIDVNSGHSMFTLVLLDGLRGKADIGIEDAQDRIVDTHELQLWIRRKIYTLTEGRQLPVIQVRPRPVSIFKF